MAAFKIYAPRAGELISKKATLFDDGRVVRQPHYHRDNDLTILVCSPDYGVATTVEGRTLWQCRQKRRPAGLLRLRSGESNAVVVSSYGLDLLWPAHEPALCHARSGGHETLPGLPLI